MSDIQERDRRTFVSTVAAAAGMGSLAGCGFLQSQGEPPKETLPTAGFSFDYDPQAKALEIIHAGGDPIERAVLEVEGEGFVEADGVDQSSAGTWQGDASESIDGTPAVTQDDSVVVGASADHDMRVTWRASENSEPKTLATTEGPDA